MLKQRIITALILLPVVFVLLFQVHLQFFAALVLVIVYLMAVEWAKLSGLRSATHASFFALFISSVNLAIWKFSEEMIVWPSISWPHHFQAELPLIFLILALVVTAIAVLIVFTFSRNNTWWQKFPLRLVFGMILLPSFFVAFVSLRTVGYSSGYPDYGGKLLLFMLLMIWAADTGAFVTGKLFGKTKLTKVSPNKTWEGVIGGVLLSTFIGWLGISALNLKVEDLSIYFAVVISIAIISVFGDLFESALKRVANIKDSGALLPGHGGLLDRLDSTITVAPFFFICFSYFEWFNA
jgi:phosphatidate cytidylyltransferase